VGRGLLSPCRTREAKLEWAKLLGHVLATLATNLSLATTHAASALAVKMAEPITTALVQRLLLSASVSLPTMVSLPLVVAGAVLFAVDQASGKSWSLGALLAFLSNLCLAARNTALKLEHGQGHPLSLRPFRNVLGILVTFTLAVAAAFLWGHVRAMTSGPVTWSALTSGGDPAWPVMLVTVSALMHVLYSYVSTGVVLRHLSVVSHALANVMKRVLVVTLLYLGGSRSATSWNFLGLGLSILGLFIYTEGKIREAESKSGEFVLPGTLGNGVWRVWDQGKGSKTVLASSHRWDHIVEEISRTSGMA